MIEKFFRTIVGILFITLSLSLQARTTILKEVGKFDYYVLALTWQPAFCESRTKHPSCRSQSPERFDAYHFVLHGLWPNVKGDRYHRYGYCDISRNILQKDKKRQWCRMPELDLSNEVKNRLTKLMPGTVSCLQRHEWYKHGSCSGLSENNYYALSNRLVEMFSRTHFNQTVAENVGKHIKRHELLTVFDKEFGKGSRDYLVLKCKKVRGTSLLTEIQIHLKKDIGSANNFRSLFPKEKPKIWGSCPSRFKIDEVGN